MGTNNGYAEQTRRLLADAQSELGSIENDIAGLEARRATLEAETQAYELALQGYFRRLGKQEAAEPDWVKILGDEKTHKKRLRAIAEYKGGRIKVSEATDILYTKGFMHAKKRTTAYAIVQANLADMAEWHQFEKVGPGEYKLVGSQQSLMK